MKYFSPIYLLNLLLVVWLFIVPWLMPKDYETNEATIAGWNIWIVVAVIISSASLVFQDEQL